MWVFSYPTISLSVSTLNTFTHKETYAKMSNMLSPALFLIIKKEQQISISQGEVKWNTVYLCSTILCSCYKEQDVSYVMEKILMLSC